MDNPRDHNIARLLWQGHLLFLLYNLLVGKSKRQLHIESVCLVWAAEFSGQFIKQFILLYRFVNEPEAGLSNYQQLAIAQTSIIT